MVQFILVLVMGSFLLTGCQQTKLSSTAPKATAAQAAPAPGVPVGYVPPGSNPNLPPPGYTPPPPGPGYTPPPNYPPPPVNPPTTYIPPTPPPSTPNPVEPPVRYPENEPGRNTNPPNFPPLNPTNDNIPANPPTAQTPVVPVFTPPSIRDPEVVVPPPATPNPGPGTQVFEQPPQPVPVPVQTPVQPQTPAVTPTTPQTPVVTPTTPRTPVVTPQTPVVTPQTPVVSQPLPIPSQPQQPGLPIPGQPTRPTSQALPIPGQPSAAQPSGGTVFPNGQVPLPPVRPASLGGPSGGQPAQPNVFQSGRSPLPPARPASLSGPNGGQPAQPDVYHSGKSPLPPARPEGLMPPPVDPGKPVESIAGQCGPVALDAKEKIEEAKLDVLFMLDTSASLRGGVVHGKEGELAQLASQIGKYVEAFPDKTDIRIAVMLGHGTGRHVGTLYSSGKGDPAVLKVSDFGNDRNRLARILKQKMESIPNESGGAQGEALMYSLYQSINKASLRAEASKEFYRKDAALAVIFMTDEQDVCYDYSSGNYKPVGKVVKNKKGEIISKIDPIEEAFFNGTCKTAGPGKTLLTPGVVYSALESLKQKEKIILMGVVYTDEKLTPKPGREDENEMGHGIIELVGLSGRNNLADLNTVQEGPEKFGPEVKYFAELTKSELQSSGKIRCQPEMNIMSIDTRTVKAQVLNDKGETIGVFSEDCSGKSCGAGKGGMTLRTQKDSRSAGYLQATLDQKVLNNLLNAHKTSSTKVLFTFMSRTDRDVKNGEAIDPKTGKPVASSSGHTGNGKGVRAKRR